MTSLRCHALSKSFGGTRAVDRVTLSFPSGAATALIGPNGAGKTTLVDLLTGVQSPDGGLVLVDGVETTGWPPHRLVRAGVVRTFQELRLVRQVSVLENVLVGLARPGEDGLRSSLFLGRQSREQQWREQARTLLDRVGLAEAEHQLAGELSYGQQKLLNLAVILSTGAEVLIFDEPVAGVHPELAFRIVEILRDLVREGRTVVFIEHDLDSVRRVADLVVLMDSGRVVLDGPPEEVFAQSAVLEAYLG